MTFNVKKIITIFYFASGSHKTIEFPACKASKMKINISRSVLSGN